MPETLAAESPLIFPTPIEIPSDSDSPIASGQLRTALKALADRTDHINGRTMIVDTAILKFSGASTIDSATAPSASWSSDAATEITVTAGGGDQLVIDADVLLKSAGSNDVSCAIELNGSALIETIRTTNDTDSPNGMRAHMHTIYTFAGGAVVSHTIRIAIKPDGADDVSIEGYGAIRAMVLRTGA